MMCDGWEWNHTDTGCVVAVKQVEQLVVVSWGPGRFLAQSSWQALAFRHLCWAE